MGTNEKFIKYLKDQNNLDELVKENVGEWNKSKKTAEKTAQELTAKYDYLYERIIDSEIMKTSNSSTNDIGQLPSNPIEAFYVYFTYLRRKNKREEFVEIYDKILEQFNDNDLKQSPNILDTELLESYKIYYFIYKYANKHAKDKHAETDYELLNEDNKKNPLTQKESYKDKITNVTYADTVFKILQANKHKYNSDKINYTKYYNRCLDAMNIVLTDSKINGYAKYYFIKAKIQYLGLELGIESPSIIKKIREEIVNALDKENSSQSGLQKRTEYLVLLSELNMWEINKKIETNDSKIKDMEVNSIRKFSAFSAFVTFAVGLISKFMNSAVMPFNETVGYFLVLLSISTTIFSFFDLIVLGPLAINSSYKAVKNQKSDYRFNVREIIKFTLKFVVEVGIIVGTFYLGMKIGGINLF